MAKRPMAWKGAMMAMRVVGDKEGEGVEEGNEDEEVDGDSNVGGG